MSNSIIDQQRDNADFQDVFCASWSPWLGSDFDFVATLEALRFKKETHLNPWIISHGNVEGLFQEIQKMMQGDQGHSKRTLHYWTESDENSRELL